MGAEHKKLFILLKRLGAIIPFSYLFSLKELKCCGMCRVLSTFSTLSHYQCEVVLSHNASVCRRWAVQLVLVAAFLPMFWTHPVFSSWFLSTQNFTWCSEQSCFAKQCYVLEPSQKRSSATVSGPPVQGPLNSSWGGLHSLKNPCWILLTLRSHRQLPFPSKLDWIFLGSVHIWAAYSSQQGSDACWFTVSGLISA